MDNLMEGHAGLSKEELTLLHTMREQVELELAVGRTGAMGRPGEMGGAVGVGLDVHPPPKPSKKCMARAPGPPQMLTYTSKCKVFAHHT